MKWKLRGPTFWMKKRRKRICTVSRAEYIPNRPISEPIASSFNYKAVAPTLLFWFNFALIFPRQEYLPTTIQMNHPSPVDTSPPDSIIGDGISCGSFLISLSLQPSLNFSYCFSKHDANVSFLSSSGSPVMADSLDITPVAEIATPSTGILIPALICTISPTFISLTFIFYSSPFRFTITFSSAWLIMLNFMNSPSFWKSFIEPTRDTTSTATKMAVPSIHAICLLLSNIISIVMAMQAHTMSNFNMKSSRAPRNNLQKGVREGGGLKFEPKCLSLSSKSVGDRPLSRLVLSCSANPWIPP